MNAYAAIRNSRQYVYDALVAAMENRPQRRDTWVEDERLAVAVAANDWAEANGFARRITVEDVEHIEGNAVGHVDYASKLSLYVAEFLVDPQPWQEHVDV